MLKYCPAAQPPREGIMLCFSMSQYILAFMVPSMNCSSPVLAALMQPQTMTLPPPCLTVGKTHLSLYSSPGCHHMLDTTLNQISLSWTAMQTNLMQCAAYGLSTNRLTPHPFNLCSNAGRTHTSISQTQPLDMTLRSAFNFFGRPWHGLF